MAILIGAAAVVWLTATIYPDQVFSAYLQTHRWLAAAGPIQKLSAPSPTLRDLMRPPQGQSSIRSVLLPPSAATLIASDGTWQPTKADVDGLEASLWQVSNLRQQNGPASGRSRIDHPEQYFRQYVAVIRKGKKLIYVNAFCHQDYASYWREQLVAVLDGGACFWQALYDPSIGRFSALTVNGEA
jgi:hypothetical protein